ncbi:MAG: non-heme iron oxygenase ferredoxin subunit [Gammaproteobacteria bacterium]
MSKIKVCAVDGLEVGQVKQVEVADRDPIAVYRLADGYYATNDVCTHGAAFLSEGDIEGTEIYCPFHAGAFDIRSGEPTAAPCVIPLQTYPVSVEGADVFVEL